MLSEWMQTIPDMCVRDPASFALVPPAKCTRRDVSRPPALVSVEGEIFHTLTFAPDVAGSG